MKKKHAKTKRTLTLLSIFTVAMFAFGFALVPFYNLMCQTLGINGKTSNTASYAVGESKIDKSRTVTVEFVATNNESLPWDFRPNTTKIKLHPGEMHRISYFAKNNTHAHMMVQAIPSVSPGIAAKYLKKTECFCFTQQTLQGQESMEMPLLFHLDTDLPKNVTTITLSYTLFDVTNMKLKPNKKAGRIS